MIYTEYNVWKARRELEGKKIRFKLGEMDPVEWVCYLSWNYILVCWEHLVDSWEENDNNISWLERIEILDEDELKEWDIVYVSDQNEEMALERKKERIYLCTIPWKATQKYVCVNNGCIEDYKIWQSYQTDNRKYIVKKPKEENNWEFNITIEWKKYKWSISDLEECSN